MGVIDKRNQELRRIAVVALETEGPAAAYDFAEEELATARDRPP